jgi:hypothetical protein
LGKGSGNVGRPNRIFSRYRQLTCQYRKYEK